MRHVTDNSHLIRKPVSYRCDILRNENAWVTNEEPAFRQRSNCKDAEPRKMLLPLRISKTKTISHWYQSTVLTKNTRPILLWVCRRRSLHRSVNQIFFTCYNTVSLPGTKASRKTVSVKFVHTFRTCCLRAYTYICLMKLNCLRHDSRVCISHKSYLQTHIFAQDFTLSLLVSFPHERLKRGSLTCTGIIVNCLPHAL